MKDISCDVSGTECPKSVTQCISEAIAARDKWWISQIQEMFDNPEWEPDYHCGCGAYFERKWQQLKREVGQ